MPPDGNNQISQPAEPTKTHRTRSGRGSAGDASERRSAADGSERKHRSHHRRESGSRHERGSSGRRKREKGNTRNSKISELALPRWQDASKSKPGVHIALGCFWLLLFLANLLTNGPWAGYHGLVLFGFGIISMFAVHRVYSTPPLWAWLAVATVALGCLSLLPLAGLGGLPEWRARIEQLGIATGPTLATHPRVTFEKIILLSVTLAGGFWLMGFRPAAGQVRVWSLAFVCGAAVHALLAKLLLRNPGPEDDPVFGFFPESSHTSALLAMAVVCGLGGMLQSARDRRWISLGIGSTGTIFCYYAIVSWAKSDTGLLMVGVGAAVWVTLMGTRYLGKTGLRLAAILLIGLASGWLLLMLNQRVAARDIRTNAPEVVLEANPTGDPLLDFNIVIRPAENPESPPEGSQVLPGDEIGDEIGKVELETATPQEQQAQEAPKDLRWFQRAARDFMPIQRDAARMILAHPLVGVGGGQFETHFPPHRKTSLVTGEEVILHPHSDWLWHAAEYGIPSLLALVALMVYAGRQSVREIRLGRDRALRAGCLAAAMVLPLQGLFDSPAHQLSLIWSSIFVFTLSLLPSARLAEMENPSPLPSRILAACCIMLGLWLVTAQWIGGPRPAHTKIENAVIQAEDHYQRHLALGRQAGTGPPRHTRFLEVALEGIDAAAKVAPLERRLLASRSRILHELPGHDAERDALMETKRILDPISVDLPLRQAEMLAKTHPAAARELHQEALRRADKVDALVSGTAWSRQATLQRLAAANKRAAESESESKSVLGSPLPKPLPVSEDNPSPPKQ